MPFARRLGVAAGAAWTRVVRRAANSAALALVPLLAVSGGLHLHAGGGGGSLGAVSVTGAAGSEPTLSFAKPLSVASTKHRVVADGGGERLTDGAKVVFDYSLVNGRTGKQVSTSYGAKPQGAVLDRRQTMPGLVKGLVGSTVGSRLLIAVAPKDAGASDALRSAGVKGNDTLVFVVDVRSVRHPLARAAGVAVTPSTGLPVVQLDASGKPSITLPGTSAPSGLVVQPLVRGGGAAVTSGQTLTVHYSGWIWTGGKQFDSSWTRGEPTDFAIGAGQVIKGWDEGLVGQPVGSQVLLVIPPAQGYGTQGNANAGISGTDTLVFVVDILDAY